jgi:glycosyltransferase involved in cell wall biosynthesis
MNGPGGARPTLVSVVIPTHGRRELLLRSLRSALAQRDVELEVLVVDDGSMDDTASAVRSVDDPRVRLLRHPTSRGVATARNTGAAVAAGAWFAFLDDDDLWAPDKLARQMAAAGPDGARWAYSGAVEIDGSGRLLGGQRPPPPEFLVRELRHRNPMPAGCSNVLVDADVFRASGGFDVGLRHLADWDLWLRLAHEGLPARVADPSVAYRLHPGQATLDTTGMLAEARTLRDRHGADLRSIRRWLAWSHLRQGRRGKAVAAYARAAVAGDLASIGRAAVAALHPFPTAVRRRPVVAEDRAWAESASAWISAAIG